MAWLIHKSTQNATPQLSEKATHRTRYQLPTHLACSLPAIHAVIVRRLAGGMSYRIAHSLDSAMSHH